MPEYTSRDNPLFWVGGKTKLSKTLIGLLPPPDQVSHIIEVFGGSGAFMFQLPVEYQKRNTYCEVDGDLINFFNVVREDPEGFVQRCQFVPYSRENWFEWKNSLRKDGLGAELDPMERAIRFFYILRAAFAGNINGSGGSWAHTVNGQNWKPNNFRSAVGKIWNIAERFSTVQIDDRSYEETIPHYDSPSSVFFLDPPYFESAANTGYYMHDFTLGDHEKLAKLCNEAQGKFIVTYYSFPQMHEFYPPEKWRYLYVDTKTSCLNKTAEKRDHDKTRQEVIILNYDAEETTNDR